MNMLYYLIMVTMSDDASRCGMIMLCLAARVSAPTTSPPALFRAVMAELVCVVFALEYAHRGRYHAGAVERWVLLFSVLGGCLGRFRSIHCGLASRKRRD